MRREKEYASRAPRALSWLALLAGCLLAVGRVAGEGGAGDAGQPSPEQMVNQFFSQFGGKDRVTLQDFLRHARETFKKLDQDGDGVVTRAEVTAMVKKQQAMTTRIEPKMRKLHSSLESFKQKGGDLAKVQPIIRKIEAAAQAGKPEEVEKHLDEALAVIEQHEKK